MVYDKVVDSITLDKSLSYTADRIRAKTGNTAQMSFDMAKGFGDAVDAIKTGGGEASVWESLSAFQISGNTTMTEVVANIPNVTTLKDAFILRKHPLKKIELTVSSKLISLERMFGNGSPQNLSEVIFHGDLSKVKNLVLAFSASGTGISDALKKIVGLDFTSVTSATSAFGSLRGLVDLEIKANTVNVALNLDASRALTVTSCINVLNALIDRTDQDALTLTLASELTDASTGRLYVNYVKLDADSGLYVSCEQADEGAMTIAAAITAKNWTIA